LLCIFSNNQIYRVSLLRSGYTCTEAMLVTLPAVRNYFSLSFPTEVYGLSGGVLWR